MSGSSLLVPRTGMTLVLVLAGSALPGHAMAQVETEWPQPDAQAKVGARLVAPSTVHPGGEFEIALLLAIEQGWHINSLADNNLNSYPTRVELELPEGWSQQGPWTEPEAHPFQFPGSGDPVMVHEGRVRLAVKVLAPADAALGPQSLRGSLEFQTCNNQVCQPPDSIPISVPLQVGDGGAPEKNAEPIIDQKRKWGAQLTLPGRLSPGSVALAEIRIETAPGWHVYALSGAAENVRWTELKVDTLTQGLRWVDPQWRAPPPHLFNASGTEVDVYEGRVVFQRAFEVDKGTPAGELTVEGVVGAMACDDKTCLLPATVAIQATLKIDTSLPVTNAGRLPPVRSSGSGGTAGLGLWELLLLAVGGAMLSWVMPCVYPMIPINISFFGKVAEKKHANRVAVASSYGIGIAGTFIVIGLIVAVLAMAFVDASERGDLAQIGNVIATNAWLNLVVGLMFVAFALSMFGLFEIRVPNWLINRADSAGRSARSTHVGAILLGVTFALASFTCTVPVVGGLLVVAASGTVQGLFESLYGMTIYGAVFAAPFVLLSLSPGALASLPKAGGWMETVKVGFGFLELGVALKFLWVPDKEWSIGLLTRPVVLWMLLGIGLVTVAFFLGAVKIGHGLAVRPFRVSAGRWACAALTVALALPYLESLRAGAPHYQSEKIPRQVAAYLVEAILPPTPTGDDLARKEGWFVDDYQGALEQARKLDRPLFVDFTGVYCGNCRSMEGTVFPLPKIKVLLEKMVRTRLYVDGPEEKHKEFARLEVDRYGNSSQPYYVILDPRDEATLAEKGGYIPGDFEDLLRSGLEEFKKRREDPGSEGSR